MNKINLAISLSLISWPVIFILSFLLYIRSTPFLLSIVNSMAFGAFPLILSICLIYNFYRHNYESNRNTKIIITISDFTNINEIKKEIKEKRSDLNLLEIYPHKSFIIDIQKKTLKKELKLLEKLLLKIERDSLD